MQVKIKGVKIEAEVGTVFERREKTKIYRIKKSNITERYK